jgi:hypothetical protein
MKTPDEYVTELYEAAQANEPIDYYGQQAHITECVTETFRDRAIRKHTFKLHPVGEITILTTVK